VLFDKVGDNRHLISEVLTKLTSFAQQNNVIIFLIAHPTKMKKSDSGAYDMPNLYDVSGSADFRNQTHDGFCVYRIFEDENNAAQTIFKNLKTKFSFQGEIGAVKNFKYHLPSGRYYVEGNPYNPNCLEYIKKPEQLAINPKTIWDKASEDKDYCPF
jgi:twinkle protein